MIVKREWTKRRYSGLVIHHYTGWFLLGFLPLYIVRETV